MITEDYCSPEVRKLLKAKGFPTGVGSWSKGFIHDGDGYVGGLVKHEDSITHQMAMKWLRDKHHIHIMISIGFDEDKMFYHPNPAQFDTDRITYGNPIETDFSTYEEAVEAALKYSLENLI